MEHTKKIILVDPRVLDSVRTSTATGPPIPDAASDSFREMDQQMRDMLDRSDMNLQDKMLDRSDMTLQDKANRSYGST